MLLKSILPVLVLLFAARLLLTGDQAGGIALIVSVIAVVWFLRILRGRRH